jgi:hypothetical protein
MRLATSLALIALTMHFTLAFGHTHVEGLINFAISIVSGPGSADSSVGALPASHGLPAGPSKSSDQDDYCAICANINLASSLLTPATPLLVVLPRASAQPARVREFEPTRQGRIGFDARGPPLT